MSDYLAKQERSFSKYLVESGDIDVLVHKYGGDLQSQITNRIACFIKPMNYNSKVKGEVEWRDKKIKKIKRFIGVVSQ